jgi:hypothetical protein
LVRIGVARIGQYRTGAGDNGFEVGGSLFGAVEHACRPHICRSVRIDDKQSRDAILVFRVETPIGEGGKIEKARRLVLRGVDHAASLPQTAVG